MLKFGRNYKLTIQIDDTGNVIEVAFPLTLDFLVSRANLSSAANATFRIYNLNPNRRQQVYKAPNDIALVRAIKLEAGYGDSLSTIFNGFIREAQSYRPEGTINFITEIAAYDYSLSMPTQKCNRNIPAPTTYKNIIDILILEDLKATIGAVGAFPELYPGNFTFCGNAWDALKLVTSDTCYIDNGKIFCLHDDEAIEGAILEVSSESGLLGTPKLNGQWIVFDTLFEPGLQIGQILKLNSRTIPQWNGTYKVIGLDHNGTISGAVGGRCKTTVRVMLGSANKSQPFNIVQEGS
jgi:hypothetical protein